MYKSPIELKVKDIVSDVVKQVDEYTLRCFQQIGINVDKHELIKALEYDRGQYEKGWNDCRIASQLGCHSGTVGDWRKKNGLPPNKKRKKRIK